MGFCGRCGQARDPRAWYCVSCGTSFQGAATPPPPPPPGWGYPPPAPVFAPLPPLPTGQRVLGNVVAASLYGMAALSVIFAAASAHLWARWQDFLATVPGSAAEAATHQSFRDSYSFHEGALGVWVLGLLAAGVCFMVWLYQSARNAQAFGATGTLGPAWAVGSWFIPLAQLVMPVLVVSQTWRASDPGLPAPVGGAWLRSRVTPLVAAWWAPFVAGYLIFFFAAGFDPMDSDWVGMASWSYALYGVCAVLMAVAGVCGAMLVHRLTARQEDRIEAFWPRPPLGPPPAFQPGYAAPVPTSFAPPGLG